MMYSLTTASNLAIVDVDTPVRLHTSARLIPSVTIITVAAIVFGCFDMSLEQLESFSHVI